jgi:pyridoxal phosphate phosphatase PHOSPHO2
MDNSVKPLPSKTLIIWDFDWTLINENSDTWLIKQLGGDEEYKHMKSKMKEYAWTNLMKYELERITSGSTPGVQKYTAEEIANTIASIPVYEENLDAIRLLGNNQHCFQCCVSDANTFFIESYFDKMGIRDHFQEIHTNPAKWTENGVLDISPYVAVDVPHGCPVCSSSPNMCKGAIVDDIVARNGPFDQMVYLGDGRGDYCGCTRMRKDDIILAREDCSLSAKIKNDKEEVKHENPDESKDTDTTAHLISCENIVTWSHGGDILRTIKNEVL